MVACGAVGLPLLAVTLASTPFGPVHRHYVIVLALTVTLVVGEMRPIPVARGDRAGDEISISTTIALAMTYLLPIGISMGAQAVALLADEVRSRRDWTRLLFNVSQYSTALLASRVTYAWLADQPVFSLVPWHFTSATIGPALVSSVAFFVINNTLTDIAVALKLRRSITRHTVADISAQIPTSGVLVGLAPVLAQGVQWSVWTLPLMLLPLAAVHRSARLAFEREHDALHDSLTGLPNRSLFNTRLVRACGDLDRRPAAVLLLDLDHFKEINDTLGHHVGDLVIVEVARRLRAALREADIVARLGGDEFAVLAPNVSTQDEAIELAGRLTGTLTSSFVIDGVRLDVQTSIGYALAPVDGTEATQLMRRADVALYRAKETRGSSIAYDETRDEHSLAKLTLLAELRHGLETGDVHLLYQPKVSCRTGGIVGVEALVRWQHPERGLLGPSEFVGIAENTGLIDAMTLVLLESSCAQLAAWHADGWMLELALNLSPRTLLNPQLVSVVGETLMRHGISPRWLTLEVTETTIMSDVERSIGVIAGLRRMGVRVSIDDFGTGYSSLAYLKALEVDEIKVDKGFLHGITTVDDAVIARSTVDLGHALGLTVVAEGVETQEQFDVVLALGCDVLQGFFISPPISSASLLTWLRTADATTQAKSRRATHIRAV
jgi:diguanylate cyclase (GGDEF)-like protein